MNLLPFSWQATEGQFHVGATSGPTRITVKSRENSIRLFCPNGFATLCARPPFYALPWRRRAIRAASEALSTIHLRGWLPSTGTLVDGSAHAHLQAAAWMEQHSPTLARGIDALRVEGDSMPWGLYGIADAGTILCLQVDERYLLPLLPIS